MSTDQRSAFRIQMPEGQKRAQLRVEGRTFDVQLIDASATGVALACPLTVALEIGNSCELLAASGGGYIRVVRKEVFSDGILLGAERTGDKPAAGGGFASQLMEWLTWPASAFLASNQPVKIGLIAAFVALIGGFGFAATHWHWFGSPPMAVTTPIEGPADPQPSAEEVQRFIQQVNDLLPEVKPAVSESDQRALRIFEQQKQLLSPETSRRLRLSPSQENQIERALKAAEGASDTSHPAFWETIRRTELQILRILTPAQVKAWRQLQSDT
jgi:hypothetical protein